MDKNELEKSRLKQRKRRKSVGREKIPSRKAKDLDFLKEKRKKFLPRPSKPIRVEGISPEPVKKLLPKPSKPIKVEGLSPEPSKIKNTYGPDRTSQKGVSKLALKGGGRAYGRNS